jgi:hypothetical protein
MLKLEKLGNCASAISRLLLLGPAVFQPLRLPLSKSPLTTKLETTDWALTTKNNGNVDTNKTAKNTPVEVQLMITQYRFFTCFTVSRLGLGIKL